MSDTPRADKQETRQSSEFSGMSCYAKLLRIWIDPNELSHYGGAVDLRLDFSGDRNHRHRIDLNCGKRELAETLRSIARYIESDPNL